MYRSRRLSSILQLLLLAVPLVQAQGITPFDLYKNSGFGPCDGLNIPPQDVQFWSSVILSFPSQIAPPSQYAFCAVFSTWTLLPSEPFDSAFYQTWAQLVLGVVSIYGTALGLYTSTPKKREDKVSKRIFLPTLLYGLAQYGLWWRRFSSFVANPPQGPSVSVISWFTTIQYFFSLDGTRYHAFRWLSPLFAAPQVAAIFYVVSVYLRGPLQEDQYLTKVLTDYRLDAEFQPQQGSICAIQQYSPTIFNDGHVWRGRGIQAVAGLGTFLGVLVTVGILQLLRSCNVALSEKWGSNRAFAKFCWAATLIWALLAFAFYAFGFAKESGVPVAWDATCRVVNIMMSGRLGFYDVKVGRLAERIILALFNVY